MAQIITFPAIRVERVHLAGEAADCRPQLVAMPHLHLPTVVGAVRMMRKLDDQSFLDRFNRAR